MVIRGHQWSSVVISTVPTVLDRIVGAPGHELRDLRPARSERRIRSQDDCILLLCPRVVPDGWVKLVAPDEGGPQNIIRIQSASSQFPISLQSRTAGSNSFAPSQTALLARAANQHPISFQSVQFICTIADGTACQSGRRPAQHSARFDRSVRCHQWHSVALTSVTKADNQWQSDTTQRQSKWH